jgi:hypothetical protein
MFASRAHALGARPAGDWISSADALPQEGQVVEFVLEYRDIAMTGVYQEQVFRTRWSRYEPASICEWRRVEAVSA